MIHTVLIAAVLITAASSLCNFEGQWQHFDRSCFYISGIDTIRNFTTSVERCKLHGAVLVSVETRKQSDFVVNSLLNCTGCLHDNPQNQYWIGLRKTIAHPSPEANATVRRLGWTWTRNAWYEWQNWHGNEPDHNEGYVRMFDNGEWAGAGPQREFRYVCERDDTTVPLPNATSGSTLSQSSTTPTETPIDTPEPTSKVRSTPSKNGDRTSYPSTSYTTQSDNGAPDKSKEKSMFLYIGPALGVLLLIVIGVVIFIVYRRRRAKTKANNMYYNTRDNLNNRPPKDVNLHNTYDTQLPPGHNLSPAPIGPMYAEIDKDGKRNSLKGPPTANKPVDNGRISAMYAQPDLTAKRNRRNLKTTPDEDVTLVENSTYATTLPK